MIHTSELSKDYGRRHALRGLTMSVSKNEVVGLLGPNGAGKTTLMKILTGYLHPSAGAAAIDGLDVVERSRDVQHLIGYMPENAPLYEDMLVQEYLVMISELREISDQQRLTMIGEAVRATGLEDHLVLPIGELSKGFRQRVGLAQAILHKPRVLILDEPTSGLDPTQIVEIRRLIAKLAGNSTIFLSTHILSEVEASCERVLIIAEGQLRADARLDDLRSTDAALVSVEGGATDCQSHLSQLDGVDRVREVDREAGTSLQPPGFQLFRVEGQRDDLCPAIFDLARGHGWRLAELRRVRRDLEAVFREVVEQPGGGMA